MKSIALIFSLCLSSAIVSAQNYTIKGKALPDTKVVYIQNFESKQKDSINVVNGEFTLKGNAGGKIFANIINGQKISLPVILEGNLSVDFNNQSVSGNEENMLLTQCNNGIMNITAKIEALQKETYAYQQKNKTMPDSVEKKYSQQFEQLYAQFENKVIETCTNNRNKKFPAILLAKYHYMIAGTEIIRIADTKPEFMKTGLMKNLNKMIEGWRRQEVGKMFTDLVMADTEGNIRKLSDFAGKGKYVLVDFWASWCGPCRASMPELKKMYNRYHDKGLEIVGVSFDSKKEAWINAIKKLELPWKHISDLKGWDCAANEVYGISSIPATMLIGPDGKIVVSDIQSNILVKTLEKIFSK